MPKSKRLSNIWRIRHRLRRFILVKRFYKLKKQNSWTRTESGIRPRSARIRYLRQRRSNYGLEITNQTDIYIGWSTWKTGRTSCPYQNVDFDSVLDVENTSNRVKFQHRAVAVTYHTIEAKQPLTLAKEKWPIVAWRKFHDTLTERHFDEEDIDGLMQPLWYLILKPLVLASISMKSLK